MAKPLMFMGTASGVGKTLLAAALCRIASSRGVRVAPFKAQNMSLNSFVTADGCEIGRAQALQALACGIQPEARFNPILLKPLGNQRSQVIVMGKPIGEMSWREYKARAKELEGRVIEAWASLQKDFDWIIIEGAGSPAEINLRKDDLANMRIAHLTDARALLVADIDKGGAFAALAGTMLLLSHEDRKRVAGYILNRFRGDECLLERAMQAVSRKTGRPFYGIVPMLEDLRLPEEDSAGLPLAQKLSGKSSGAGSEIDIAVIAWPNASNLTDIEPLERCCGHGPRLARQPGDIGRADLVILPGTRNAGASLAWLRKSGIAAALLAWLDNVPKNATRHLLGICGGLEILGQEILDPLGLEGPSVPGLGLLPFTSALERKKTLRRNHAHAQDFLQIGPVEVDGYEIHHGQAAGTENMDAALMGENGSPCGWGLRKNSSLIWGTWLHGLFDGPRFRNAYLKKLAMDNGKCWHEAPRASASSELDRLASLVEQKLDMGKITRLAGISL